MGTEQDTPELELEQSSATDTTSSDANESVTAQTETAETSSAGETTVEELKQQLAQAQAKASENWDKAVRMQAEMENLKRRVQKDLENAHKFALENFSKELLGVIDSLELGLQAIAGDSDEVKKFREGTELTLKLFESAFTKFNIQAINPLGLPFNPEHHQAMAMQPSAEVAPNTVLNVFQKGYLLNDRLIRPAMVVVAKAAD